MSWMKSTLLVLPHLVLLSARLLRDDRVPARTKLLLVGLAAYLASPWDIIPDFIPVLGQLDDLVALLLLANVILDQVDEAILVEHWPGDVQMLMRLRKLARVAGWFVPARVRTMLLAPAGAKRAM